MFKDSDNIASEDLIDIVLMFLLSTLNIFHFFSSASIADFEQVNVSWVFKTAIHFVNQK